MAAQHPSGRTGSSPAGRALEDGREQDFVGARDLTHWPSALGRGTARLAARAGRWLDPHQVLGLTLLVGLVLTGVLGSLAAVVYDGVVESDGVTGLDQPALHLAMGLRSPGLDALVTGYTMIGGPVGMPVLATGTAVVLSLAWRRWTPFVLIASTMLGSLALTVAGKAAVARVRPPLADAVRPYEGGFSFPSGHSLNAVAFAGVTAYLLLRRLRSRWARRLTVVLAVAFAATMGLSRVFLGQHWLTDVLVAWALGLAWLTVVITAHRLLLTLRRRPPAATGAAPAQPAAAA